MTGAGKGAFYGGKDVCNLGGRRESGNLTVNLRETTSSR